MFDTYKVKGIDAGRAAWYIVAVDTRTLGGFKAAIDDDIIHLEVWGDIVKSAYGDDVDSDEYGRCCTDFKPLELLQEQAISAIETDVDALQIVRRALCSGLAVTGLLTKAAKFGRVDVVKYLLHRHACPGVSNSPDITVAITGELGKHQAAGQRGWGCWSAIRNACVALADPLQANTTLANTVSGGIMLVERTAQSMPHQSTFSEKAYHAQLAGAEGVLAIDRDPEDEDEDGRFSTAPLTGLDHAAEVKIPMALIARAPGLQLLEAIRRGTKPRISFTGMSLNVLRWR
jgi:hypothetical protein